MIEVNSSEFLINHNLMGVEQRRTMSESTWEQRASGENDGDEGLHSWHYHSKIQVPLE